MSWADSKRILKGIAVLFIFIILGVMAAEKQINTLTEYHGFVQACSIQDSANESYALYFLGNRYALPSIIGDYLRFVKKGQLQDIIPAKAREYAVKVNALFIAAREGSVKSANQTKKWLEEKWQELFYEIENY